MTKHYVVYCLEHMRDGSEECCWIVSSLEAVATKIQRLRDSFGGCNMTFKLFHLGTEIPLPPKESEVLG